MVMAAGTAASRLTGFIALAVLASALGFTRLTDTYNLANTAPNMVYDLLLGGVLSAALVPLFVEHHARDDRDADAAVVSVAVIALLAVTVVAILAVPAIVEVYTLRSGALAGAEQRMVARSLLRFFMPQVFLYGVAALLTALLQARRRFAAAAFAPAVANVAEIGLFVSVGRLAGPRPDLHQAATDHRLVVFLGLGTTLALTSMLFCLVPPAVRAGVVLRWRPRWRHPAVRRLGRLSGWTLAYVAVNQAALAVVLVLANGHAGGVAAYQAAYTFFQLPHGLVAVSLMTAITPELARRALSADLAAYRARFAGGLRLLWLVTVAAAAGYVVLARPVVGVLLQRGALSASSAALTAQLLVAFAVGLPGFSVYLYTLRAFYALGDTRTPFLLAALENGINVGGAVVLERTVGLVGLPVSYSVAYGVAAVVAVVALRRRVGAILERRTAGVLRRGLLAAVVMCLAVAGARWALGAVSPPLQLAVGLVTGIVVYSGAVSLLLHSEWTELRDAIRLRRPPARRVPR